MVSLHGPVHYRCCSLQKCAEAVEHREHGTEAEEAQSQAYRENELKLVEGPEDEEDHEEAR